MLQSVGDLQQLYWLVILSVVEAVAFICRAVLSEPETLTLHVFYYSLCFSSLFLAGSMQLSALSVWVG